MQKWNFIRSKIKDTILVKDRLIVFMKNSWSLPETGKLPERQVVLLHLQMQKIQFEGRF